MDEPTTTTARDLEGALRSCQWDLLHRAAMIEVQIGVDESQSPFAVRCAFALDAAVGWYGEGGK